MTATHTRLYRPDDLSACLAIFDSNVPLFFAASERDEFCDFLESAAATQGCYLVLVRQAVVIACGGLIADPAQGRAVLAWGMVDRAMHGQGLGTALMRARLAQAQAEPTIFNLTLATSQHTQGFYAGFGFAVSLVTPNGFAPGLDRWDMTLHLERAAGGSDQRQRLFAPRQPER